MVDPWKKCLVRLDYHSRLRAVERGLSQGDIERLIREGTRQAYGDGNYSVKYGKWLIHVRLVRCFIGVKTVHHL